MDGPEPSERPQITSGKPLAAAQSGIALVMIFINHVPGTIYETRPFARLGTQMMEAAAVLAGRGVAMLTPPFYARLTWLIEKITVSGMTPQTLNATQIMRARGQGTG